MNSLSPRVPTSAGGGNDAMARIVGNKLGERLKQPVIIENKAGANGNVAAARRGVAAYADRPLRLIGSCLYLDRYWLEEQQGCDDVLALLASMVVALMAAVWMLFWSTELKFPPLL